MNKTLAILFALLLGLGLEAEAQNLKFTTTNHTFRTCEDGFWGQWGSWTTMELDVIVDAQNNTIAIGQGDYVVFNVVECNGEFQEDNGGGNQSEFKCVDESGQSCSIRLRVQPNGLVQLYVDYPDAQHAFCLKSA